jgi:hypothetical protein
MKTQRHHVIPITLTWSNYKDNIINLDPLSHEVLHDEQNVAGMYVRRWKERTNHIILPNEFTEDERLKIVKKFFVNIWNNSDKVIKQQLVSLQKQQHSPVSLDGRRPYEIAVELLENQTQERINYILRTVRWTK